MFFVLLCPTIQAAANILDELVNLKITFLLFCQSAWSLQVISNVVNAHHLWRWGILRLYFALYSTRLKVAAVCYLKSSRLRLKLKSTLNVLHVWPHAIYKDLSFFLIDVWPEALKPKTAHLMTSWHNAGGHFLSN